MIISKQECVKAKNRNRGKSSSREKKKKKKEEKKDMIHRETFVNAKQERMK